MKTTERVYIIDNFVPNNLKYGDFCLFQRVYENQYPIKVHCNGFVIGNLELLAATILANLYDQHKIVIHGKYIEVCVEENGKVYHLVETTINFI